MADQLSTHLITTQALLTQFQETLKPGAQAQAQDQNGSSNADANANAEAKPLALLSASSTALRAQVTKLSLLTITTPFTPSAITTVLRAVNESVLPSLVTAALLVTPALYTKAFFAEIAALTRALLGEFEGLVGIVRGVADANEQEQKDKDKKKKKGAEMDQARKDTVTVSAGRVWEACDAVTGVANRGVVGFVVFRVEQWRDLIRDAVEEIEEWDPEEEGDEFFDDVMGDDVKGQDNDEDDDDDEDEGDDDEEDKAALLERKKAMLRFLKPVAQVYPAVVSNRLKGVGETPLSVEGGVAKLEKLMDGLGKIPDSVDEAAGALYEDDEERSSEFLLKIRGYATEIVSSLELPWGVKDGEQKGLDKFTIWSRTWLKVMDEVSKSIDKE